MSSTSFFESRVRKGIVVLGVGLVLIIFSVAAFTFVQERNTKSVSAAYECPENVSAVNDFDEVVKIGDSYFGSSAAYNIQCASLAYTKALTLDEKRSQMPWYQLGRIHFIQGKFEVAINRFERQIELFGTSTLPNVHYMLGLTYGYRAHKTGSIEDWAVAEKEFRTFSQLDPQSAWSRVDLAWVLFSQKKYEAMKAPLQEALVFHPNNPWVLNMYGLAQLNTGNKQLALENFTKAEAALAELSPQQWGQTYPGNDPAMWRSGLSEMKTLIAKNKVLAGG